MAQADEIARESVTAIRHKGHTRSLNSSTVPLRADFRHAYDSINLHDLAPLDPNYGGEDYETLLPSLQRFFYLETKLVKEKTAALRTEHPSGEHKKSLLRVEAHLVSSYHLLAAQEHALRVPTLTSLIEYIACSLVSAALGILVYIEGSREWTTIASLILFALALVYKAFDCAAYVLEAWFRVNEADYRRLIREARNEHAATGYQGQSVRALSAED